MFIFSQKFGLVTQWMSTNAQLNASVSRRLPCNAGWINFKVRQKKPVLQCFNLLGAPVHVTKLSASPVGFLRMYLKPLTPEHPKNRKNFQHFTIQGQGFYLSFSPYLLPGFLGVPGVRIRFPGFKTCQLFTWLSFLQSQITHKFSVLSGSHLRDMLLTLIFRKSKILFAHEKIDLSGA